MNSLQKKTNQFENERKFNCVLNGKYGFVFVYSSENEWKTTLIPGI